MTTAECIRQRVSCRRFQETPIPREDIRRVVDEHPARAIYRH